MTRRQFGFALAGGAICGRAAAATALPLLKPSALRPGDTVGVIAPSTFVSDPDKIALAQRTLEYFGLKAKFGRGLGKRPLYLGNSVEERVEDLHAMFRDPDVRAVFAVRGGYGASQLLDRIDYSIIRQNPKIFVGYSDITALHLAIQKHAGVITFHGPVLLSEFTSYTQSCWKKALFETTPLGPLTNPKESNKLRPHHILRTVRPGQARGRLIGGNLSLVAATMGTPYEIETAGRILFIEDVDEQPYSIDRMLTQLRLAGKLQQAAGIIFGECNDCRPRDYKPSFDLAFSLGEVVDGILGKTKVPVLAGLTIGHTDDQLTLPEGAMATLDADRGELIVEEAGVQ